MKTNGQRFFLGVMAPREPALNSRLVDVLREWYGPWQREVASPPLWNAPTSYRTESGQDLGHWILVFRGDYSLAEVSKAKVIAMQVEDHFRRADDGTRRFNLNPGFVSQEGMFLLSHKPAQNRWQLSEGIWVEQQMTAVNGELVPLENLFDEFRSSQRLDLLRDLYRSTLREAA